MNIIEKTTSTCYYKIDLLFPKFIIHKKVNSEFGECYITKFDLSTKLMLQDYEKRVIIDFRILGFGIRGYFSWS
jgi:hypothetical protein